MSFQAGDKLESELLGRIARGDRPAFGELYDRQSPVLYALILKILNDPTEAEDILQEAFLQIWDKATSFNPALGRPISWTVAIARNKALDRLRALQRQYQALSRIMDSQEDHPAGRDPGAVPGDTGHLVRSAVLKLPMEQRQAIELAFFGGLTQHEIAVQLRVPLGTIKARIRRGMIKLRDSLKPYL